MGLLSLLLIPVGIAHLAQNTQPPSSAGATELRVTLPTRLTADEAKINLAQEHGKFYFKFQQVRATLLHDGRSVANASIRFVVDGQVICVASTKSDGVAACDNNAKFPTELFLSAGVPASYTAYFAGAGPLQPSSDNGVLRPIGNGQAGEQFDESPDTTS